MSTASRTRPEVVAEYAGLTDAQLAKLCDLRLAEEWQDAERNKETLVRAHPELRLVRLEAAA